MAGILMFLTLSVIITFILTRPVIVKIRQNERFSVEIHFQLLALILTKEEKSANEKRRYTFRTYRRLFRDILIISERSEIYIKNFGVGKSDEEFDQNTTLRPYRIHSVVSAAIAYLSLRAQKLTLEADALDFIPNKDGFTFDIAFKTSIISAIRGAIRVMHTLKTANKVRKENG